MNLRTSKAGSYSCQCALTLNGAEKKQNIYVNESHKQLRIMLVNVLAVIGLSWSLDQKKKWYGIYTGRPHGSCDRFAEQMMMNFSQSCHPIFRASSDFERGELRSKEGVKKTFHFNGSDENIELLLRTFISWNQLSVYGGVSEKCNELSEDLKALVKPKAPDYLDKTEIPTGPSNAETQANEQQRRNLLHENEQRFEQLSEDQKLSKLCSEAGLRLVEIGQYIFALETPRRKEMQPLCREYTMPRDEEGTRVRGWIRGNERFGPVLNKKVCNHDERYSIEVQVQPSFDDQTVSWVRIVNGVDKFVREALPAQEEENKASGKPIVKARPRPNSTAMATSNFLFLLMKEDGLTLKHRNRSIISVFRVSKAIIRLLRHDSTVSRGLDGAIHHDDIIEECKKKKFINAPQWSIDDWISTLAKGGGEKKRFQYCLNPNSPNQFLYLRAIQGHSGSGVIDPALQDNVLLPEGFTECIYHVGNASELRSIILKRFDSRRKKGSSKVRQSVFFTIVKPMGDQNGLGETLRLVTTKNRAIQEHLATSSKYSILVQFGARSRERTAIVPNKVTCSRSL